MNTARKMEDSGIDSDSKGPINEYEETETTPSTSENHSVSANTSTIPKTSRKTSELQQKLMKQREAVRNSAATGDPSKKRLLALNRLPVPQGKVNTSQPSADTRPLVMIESDESEDEFALPRLSKQAQREITQQLIKDGYNLDLEPDDEDLDLIPPRPLQDRCTCCQVPFVWDSSGCILQ